MMPAPGLLFIVSAPSGAGKTSLCKAVLKSFNRNFKRPLKWSCSYTTRGPRAGEKHGVDYFFVTDREFDRMIKANEFAEWAVVHGHRYGTSKKYLRQALKCGVDLLLEIDCQGARTLRNQNLPGSYVFILPPSRGELRKRLKGRGTEPDAVIARRLKRAMSEVEEYRNYDYIIVNDQFEMAAAELEAVILAERSRLSIKQGEIKPILKQFRR